MQGCRGKWETQNCSGTVQRGNRLKTGRRDASGAIGWAAIRRREDRATDGQIGAARQAHCGVGRHHSAAAWVRFSWMAECSLTGASGLRLACHVRHRVCPNFLSFFRRLAFKSGDSIWQGGKTSLSLPPRGRTLFFPGGVGWQTNDHQSFPTYIPVSRLKDQPRRTSVLDHSEG